MRKIMDAEQSRKVNATTVKNQSEEVKRQLTPVVINLLNEFLSKDADESKLLAKIIMSASAFGGLAMEERLKALFTQLVNSVETANFDKPMISVDGEVAFELRYRAEKHPTNVLAARSDTIKATSKLSKDRFSYVRWWPDNLTKLLLQQFFVSRPKFKELQKLTFQQVLNKIYKQVSFTQKQVPPSLLFSSIFEIGVRYSKCEMPYFLITFASGKVFSGSTQLECLRNYEKSKVAAVKTRTNQKIRKKLLKAKTINTFSFEKFNGSDLYKEKVTPNQDEEFINRILALCKGEKDATEGLTCPVALSKVRNNIIQKVEKMYAEKNKLTLPSEILVGWILQGLRSPNAWEISKGTPYRYLNSLQKPWRAHWADHDITSVSEEEMGLFLIALHDENVRNNKIINNAIISLVKYMSNEFPEEIACPLDSKYGSKENHVRSMVVPELQFQQVRKDFHDIFADKDTNWLHAADACITLLFRCGCRPNEVYNLKLSDISKKADYIYIRKGKTYNAKRRLPLNIFLTPYEKKSLYQYVAKRLDETKDENIPLFVQSAIDNEQFDLKTINSVLTELLSQYSELRTVSYQFRHTAISNAVLMCFCDEEVAKKYTGHDSEFIRNVKNEYRQDPKRTLSEIMGVFGHGEAKTTLTWYCHFTDVILSHFVSKMSLSLSVAKVAKVLKISKQELKLMLPEGSVNNSLVDSCSLTQDLDKKLGRFVHTKINLAKQNEQKFYPNYMQEKIATFDDLLQIISLANEQTSNEDIATRLNIRLEFVNEFLIENMKIIKDSGFVTKRAGSTIIGKKNADYGLPYLHTKAEQQDAKMLFEKIVKPSFVKNNDLTRLMPFLKSPASKPCALFNKIGETKKTITLLKKLVEDNERLFVCVDLNVKNYTDGQYDSLKKNLEEGCFKISSTKVSSDDYSDGRIALVLQHPDISKFRYKTGSSYCYKQNGTKSIKAAYCLALCYLEAQRKIETTEQHEQIQGTFNFD